MMHLLFRIALLLQLLNLGLKYVIRKHQAKQEELELNRIHQFLVCPDDFNFLVEDINVIKKNTVTCESIA
jgi:hypothetical protein